jgi:hypothetical protein
MKIELIEIQYGQEEPNNSNRSKSSIAEVKWCYYRNLNMLVILRRINIRFKGVQEMQDMSGNPWGFLKYCEAMIRWVVCGESKQRDASTFF